MRLAAKKRDGGAHAGTQFLPGHQMQPERPAEPEGEQEPCDQYCYAFNDSLPSTADDRKCRNCKKYLTTLCDQIEQFIDEDGDVEG